MYCESYIRKALFEKGVSGSATVQTEKYSSVVVAEIHERGSEAIDSSHSNRLGWR
jgi:hypothetical protein